MQIYDVARRKLLRTLPPARYEFFAFSPDDSKLLVITGGSGNSLGTPAVEDAVSGRRVYLQDAGTVPCGVAPEDFAISASDRVVVGGKLCGYADVWNAETGRLIPPLQPGRGDVKRRSLARRKATALSPLGTPAPRSTTWPPVRPLVNLIGHTRGIGFAAFTPGASMVVTASLDDTVRVWNARTGQQLRVTDLHRRPGAGQLQRRRATDGDKRAEPRGAASRAWRACTRRAQRARTPRRCWTRRPPTPRPRTG